MVAPISVTSPSSTAGSSASCWALLKRWISSRKKIVARPPRRRSRARAITSRTSARPALTAESSSKAASACSAASRASVVLPVPGGPNRIIECGEPGLERRRAAPSPRRAGAPARRSRPALRGRMRAASGPSGGGSRRRGRLLLGRLEQAFHRHGAWVPTRVSALGIAEPAMHEAAEVLSRLVRFKTVNPPGAERECQEWLRDYLAEAGFECELLRRRGRAAEPGGDAARRASPGPCSATSRTWTPCSPTPRTGSTTRGAARCTTASCGAAGRST